VNVCKALQRRMCFEVSLVALLQGNNSHKVCTASIQIRQCIASIRQQARCVALILCCSAPLCNQLQSVVKQAFIAVFVTHRWRKQL